MYVIKKIAYHLDIVEQFIVSQFKCPDYYSRIMLTNRYETGWKYLCLLLV